MPKVNKFPSAIFVRRDDAGDDDTFLSSFEDMNDLDDGDVIAIYKLQSQHEVQKIVVLEPLS